jgi:hypothetical protein
MAAIDSGDERPPDSTDLQGWQRALAEGRLGTFRLEAIVAAIQDLGPLADKAVRNPLWKHLSDAILGILRRHVSLRHRNRGDDIIDRTHGQIIEAILRPTSADGKALRDSFVPRVTFRLKDAIIKEAAARRAEMHQTAGSQALSKPANDDAPPELRHDPTNTIHESMDVENILEQVTHDQKRLAFRLYMDGIPFKSNKSCSIATALGISERTARTWVREVQALLSVLPQVQELQKLSTRGAS